VEVDEMQSFVEKKSNQRWLWHGIDHYTGEVLAYVLGSRSDEMFFKLKKLLEPFGITAEIEGSCHQRQSNPETMALSSS
jgi:insertion element IS1 protein InsB